MGYPITTGERLKRIRHATGLSQEDFAEKLGYEKSSIGNAECGRTRLSNHLIIALVKNLDVNVEYLLEGRGEMFIDKTSDEYLAMVMDDVLKAWIDAIQRVRVQLSYNINKK